MVFLLYELKGQRAQKLKRAVTWDEIAKETGISKPTLIALAKGTAKTVRPEYLDALCAYFEVDIDAVVQPEAVALPLDLDIRPDRHGRRPGQ